MSNRTKGGATPIRDVANEFIKNLSQERLSKQKRIEKIWRKAVGKKFCRHTQPASFRRKRLVVNVDSSSWLYELTMRKQAITTKLEKALKEDFKELQLRIGDVEKQEES